MAGCAGGWRSRIIRAVNLGRCCMSVSAPPVWGDRMAQADTHWPAAKGSKIHYDAGHDYIRGFGVCIVGAPLFGP
jgi:hypothetical protein